MTHTPPIPAGNQSPYPLHEAPHVHKSDAPPPGDPRIARTPDTPDLPSPSTWVGIGVGLAAIAGGLFLAYRAVAHPQPQRTRKRRKSQARKSQARKSQA